MTNPSDAWRDDDGAPPSAQERAEAERLAALLALAPPDAARAAALDTPPVESAALLALRVRAAVHPDETASRDAARRVVDDALAHHGARSRWRNIARARWLWAAAAAVVIVGVRMGTTAPAPATPPSFSRAAETLFDRPVEPGAGSAPARLIFDARLRDYRSTLLGPESP